MPDDPTGITLPGDPGPAPSAAQRLAALDGTSPAEERGTPPTESTLLARIAELEQQLADSRATIDALERRHRIDLALIDSGAHDLDTARLLTELAVGAMEAPDIDAAVAELRRAKPFLFRHAPSLAVFPAAGTPETGAMGGAPIESGASRAVAEAARSGSRAALLRYLRERRFAG